MATIPEIMTAYEEAKSSWKALYDEMHEDFQFYQGKQWSDNDMAVMTRKKGVILNLNYIKKPVDTIAGFQRQNTTMMKAFPVEGGDDKVAEVYSRLIHWIMTEMNANHEVNKAFKDATICGLGWIVPEITFDKDILSGDILVRKEDPFNVLVDPHFKHQDLSDADYVIRHRIVSKFKLKQLFPDKEKEIDSVTTAEPRNDGIREEVTVPSDRQVNVQVIEYWHRVFQHATFLIDPANPHNPARFDGTEAELQEKLQSNPNLRPLRRNVPKIKLTIIAGDSVELFDGDNPYSTTWYPFIPIFAYIDTADNEWLFRIQGIIRGLKDAQREKNKRRSVMAEIIGKMPQYGYVIDKGAVDDIQVFKRKDNIIEKNPGKEIIPMDPPGIPPALVTFDQMLDLDLQKMGPNPDQLGQVGERGEAGVTIVQRIKQGLMSQQEMFDNLSFAKRMLGNQIIEMISENYTQEKIKRILGNDIKFIPDGLEDQMKKAAAQARQSRDEVDKQKEDLQFDLDELEARGEEFSDQAEDELIVQIDQLENQAKQAEQQAEEMQMQLAIAIADEKEFWERFDETRKSARFDIVIDETNDNPTFRSSAFEQLVKLQQFGIQQDPVSLVELSDIPTEQKKSSLQFAQQQQQLQQQTLQAEQQKEDNKTKLKIKEMENDFNIALLKEGINPKTNQPIPKIPEEKESKGKTVQ